MPNYMQFYYFYVPYKLKVNTYTFKFCLTINILLYFILITYNEMTATSWNLGVNKLFAKIYDAYMLFMYTNYMKAFC